MKKNMPMIKISISTIMLFLILFIVSRSSFIVYASNSSDIETAKYILGSNDSSFSYLSTKVFNTKKTILITDNTNKNTSINLTKNTNGWTCAFIRINRVNLLSSNPSWSITLNNASCSINISGNTFLNHEKAVTVVSKKNGPSFIDINADNSKYDNINAFYTTNTEKRVSYESSVIPSSNYSSELSPAKNSAQENHNPVPPSPKKEYKPDKDGFISPSNNIVINTCINVGDHTYVIQGPHSVSLKSTISKSKKIRIPSSISFNDDTYQVTSIETDAFKNNKSIKEVIIPNTVNIIEDNAFYGCKNLKKIRTDASSLKSFKSSAFKKIKKNAKFIIIVQSKTDYNSFVKKIKRNSYATHFTFKMIKS